MTVDKSDLKAQLATDLEARGQEMREASQADMYRHQGAQKQLAMAAANILSLSRLVDDDVDKERYDLDVAKRIKGFLARAGQQLVDMSKAEARRAIVAEGRASAAVDVMKLAQKQRDSATREKERIQSAIEEGAKPVDENDAHPGPSLKAVRLAEEAAPASKKKRTVKKSKAVKATAPTESANASDT